jgi:hypothetical protein
VLRDADVDVSVVGWCICRAARARSFLIAEDPPICCRANVADFAEICSTARRNIVSNHALLKQQMTPMVLCC